MREPTRLHSASSPATAEGLHIVVVSDPVGEHYAILDDLCVSQILPKPFRRQDLTDLITDVTDVTARID